MFIKLYASIWLLGILAVGLFYVTGNFTPLVSVAFGILSVGGVFTGMMNVLPGTISERLHHPVPRPLSDPVPRIEVASRSISSPLPPSNLWISRRQHL
jgi:hypothetical protein